MKLTLQSQSIGLPPILNWGRRAAAAGAENFMMWRIEDKKNFLNKKNYEIDETSPSIFDAP